MPYDPLSATTGLAAGKSNDPLAATSASSGGNASPSAAALPYKKIGMWTPLAKKVASTAIKGLTFPIEGLNAVLGAPQRFIAGTMAEDVKHHVPQGLGTGDYPNYGAQVLGEMGGGVYGVFRPNDERVENLAEQAYGVNKLKTADTARLRGKAQNFGVDLGFQTATDPLTYVGPGLARMAIAPTLDAVGSAMERLAALSPRAKGVLDFVRPNALVRNAYKGHELNIYEGTVEAQKAVARKVALHDESLLKEAAPHIKALKKNDPISALPHPISDRVQELLASTSVKFPKTGTMQQRLDRFFPKAEAAERENRIKATVMAHGLKYVQNPKNIGPFSPRVTKDMVALSNAGKNALFINSIPHMANVGVAQFLGSGVGGVVGGLRRAVTGDLGEFGNEMERYGATSHFSAREPSAIERATGVLGKLATKTRAVSQGALDRFETGMRAQRYNQLRKAGMDPFDAAAKVRRELFDYTNTSGLSRYLTNAGAPFPQFRVASVPTMGFNALRHAPQRLEQYARTEHLTNQDLVGKNAPYGVDFGKPPDSFSQLLDISPSFQSGTAKYLSSPSTIGPIGSIIQKLVYKETLGQTLMQLASQYVPGVSAAETVANWQLFPSKAPKEVRQILSQFGAYTKNKPKPSPKTLEF